MEILNLHDIITAGRAFLPADLGALKLAVTEILQESGRAEVHQWLALSQHHDEANVSSPVLGYLLGLNQEAFGEDHCAKFILEEFGSGDHEGRLTVTVLAGLLPYAVGEKSVVVLYCEYTSPSSEYRWEWLGVPAKSVSYLLRALPELTILDRLTPPRD